MYFGTIATPCTCNSTLSYFGESLQLLFPFELPYYDKNNIAARFVGHPLALQLNKTFDINETRQDLKVEMQNNKALTAQLEREALKVKELEAKIPMSAKFQDPDKLQTYGKA